MPKPHKKSKSPSCSSSSSSSSCSPKKRSESHHKRHRKVRRAKVADLACHVTDQVYQSIKCRLMCDDAVMLNGSDAYGSFYSTKTQTIPIGADIIFELNQEVFGLRHLPGASDIYIEKDGVFYFNFEVTTDQPAQFAVVVNGTVNPTTVTATNSGAVQLNLHQLLMLKCGDKISIRNYASAGPTGIITTSVAGGTIVPSNIADLTLMRIAPLPKDVKRAIKACKCHADKYSPMRSKSKSGSCSPKK